VKRNLRFKILQFILLISFSGYLSGQEVQKLDSLKYELESASSDSLRVKFLVEISREYSLQDLSMSLKYAERALDAARATKSDYLVTLALNNIGYVCFQNGLLEISAKYFYENIDIHRNNGNQDGVLGGMINIAAIKLMMNDFEGTRDDLLEILSLIEELDAAKSEQDTIPRYELTTVYNNLGVAYENLGEFEDAIDYYLRGVSIARRIPDQEIYLARLLNNLGKVYAEQGRSEEALEVLNEALQVRKDIGDKLGQASSYRNLARFHFDRDEHELALQYSLQGLSLAERLGSLQLLINFTSQLFELYDLNNQPDSALKYLKKSREYNDRLNSEEARQEITRMEITAQFQERELIRQMQQKRKELKYIYGGGLALLIAIILGLLFFLAQSRARRLQLANTNYQLESEKALLEKENLENQLETKNKELTTNVMYQIRKNELINDITHKLLTYSHGLNREQQDLIKGIIRDLERTQDESVWEEFEVRFHQVHNDFYDKLHQINPDLSLNERRLCAFLRLNMTTKEISSITGQSLRSIEVARTRLRKKLHLTNSDVNLTDFLLSI
jgi:tetratricopeptide (TPR) repeat protein